MIYDIWVTCDKGHEHPGKRYSNAYAYIEHVGTCYVVNARKA